MSDNTALQLEPIHDRTRQLADLGDKMAGFLETAKVYRNCITCYKFIEKMELCEYYNARPPARIIAYGCDQHGTEIPF